VNRGNRHFCDLLRMRTIDKPCESISWIVVPVAVGSNSPTPSILLSLGDLFMSLIHTAESCSANPFDYLTELQKHVEEMAVNP